MIQEIRSNEPQYICVVRVDSITNNEDEEIMTFGVSEEDAKSQAQQLLTKNYGCNESQILELIQESKIELIGQWCAPKEQQD
ncbi:hypothetical protein [Chlorogloeopsis sp. ULAP02]|uniref:hypothetical protein n=1 Tax=Chlorogloeopsis sp. ULAP02 TaxID=3107926 RepID=UPI003136E0AA